MVLPGLFVVGTDTGVGKTRVAAAIARSVIDAGHRVGVLKPVATGAVRNGDGWHSDDVELLREAIGGEAPHQWICPIVFEEPVAPVVAARLRGIPLEHAHLERMVDVALAWWSHHAEVMIVEGIGGLLTPLAEGTTVADLAVALDYPLVIVAHRGLGALNHTLLTVEAARHRGLRIAGLILNSVQPTTHPLAEATNADELSRRLDGVALLAELAYRDDPTTLSVALRFVDWYERASPPRRLEPGAEEEPGLGAAAEIDVSWSSQPGA
jgi:dethiobiotin synthetase